MFFLKCRVHVERGAVAPVNPLPSEKSIAPANGTALLKVGEVQDHHKTKKIP